jgi:hypothetical protein
MRYKPKSIHIALGGMTAAGLILKRASASRSSGEWRDDDFDVLEDGVVIGRIFFLDAVGPRDRPWASGHNGEIRRADHGYEPTREAAGGVPKGLATPAREPRGERCLGRAAINHAATITVPSSRPYQRGSPQRDGSRRCHCAPVLGLRSF